MILLCSFTELISNIRYNKYFNNYNINKNFDKYKYTIEFISFYPFFLINEKYILKIQIFRHQMLGIGIGFLLTLISIFKNKFTSNINYLSIIILIECKFLETIHYIIPKKLNSEYFININLICGIKGLFGFILSLILFIIFYFFYNFENYKIGESLTIYNLLISVIYIINSCLLNFFIFKIIEKKRPSYYLIPLLLSQIFPLINAFYGEENYPNGSIYDVILGTIKIIATLPGLIYIFLSLIFCEVIIFKCCGLDKFTKNEISKRALDEAINDTVIE